jgi:hypothetical protein
MGVRLTAVHARALQIEVSDALTSLNVPVLSTVGLRFLVGSRPLLALGGARRTKEGKPAPTRAVCMRVPSTRT